MSLRLICWAGHDARYGDRHGRSTAANLGAGQGVFGRDVGDGLPGAQGGADPVYRACALKHFDYSPHGKADKGVLLRYIGRMTSLSRQQVTRLVRQYRKDGKLSKRHATLRPSTALPVVSPPWMWLYWPRWMSCTAPCLAPPPRN